ncbi:MAG: hypothetical protein QXI11_09200 [Thermoproteota archaeon]
MFKVAVFRGKDYGDKKVLVQATCPSGRQAIRIFTEKLFKIMKKLI